MPDQNNKADLLLLISVITVLLAVYLTVAHSSEPFYNYDETRHVMTGVYFRDLIHDLPVRDLRNYTIRYYLQYPALGLFVWPPFFYFIEGVVMAIAGPSMITAKSVVLFFALGGLTYFFLLVRRSHNIEKAIVATFILGLLPLVFELSHFVMLEIPTLALTLAAIYHFVRYADLGLTRDLFLSGLLAAAAALTRFDAVFLLPLFVFLIFAQRQSNLLSRGKVWVTAAVAILIVAPIYALSAYAIGWVDLKFVVQPVSADTPSIFSFNHLVYYPSRLPKQIGWLVLVPALFGIIMSLRKAERRASLLYFAIIVATYLTFAPIAELEIRHTIYWLPAFAFFAAQGLYALAQVLRVNLLYPVLSVALLISLGWIDIAKPLPYLKGYDEAARYVVANAKSPYCLFVGHLSGDFIYQTRILDTQRTFWILRADKLLFTVLATPDIEQKALTATEDTMLATIYNYDPEFLIVEQPRIVDRDSPVDRIRNIYEDQIRTVINRHPERFHLDQEIVLASDSQQYQGMHLKIFKNTLRNPNPERRLSVDVLMLQRSLETEMR